MSFFRVSRAILAAGALVVGAMLIVRPFATLTALAATTGISLVIVGTTEVLRRRECGSVTAVPAGCLIIATGMVTAAWPGLSLPTVSLVVAVGPAVFGLARLVDAVRGTGAGRLADGLIGVGGVCLAVVALLPGPTLFTVSLALGGALVWTGVAGLFYSLGRRARVVRPQAPRIVAAALAVIVAVPLVVFTVGDHSSPPIPDAFYHAAADGAPGTLLRVAPFNGRVPDGSRAWRILYTTRNEAGRPAVAGGLVVAATGASATSSPVIAWAHPTTGVARGCAPSLVDDPFAAGGRAAVVRALAEGWTVVAADYLGLGTAGPHPYLIGRPEAQSVLDAVRAARSIDALDLADRTAVWGADQGGHAALWTDVVGPEYAPDVPLTGVAAVAPMTDLRALAQTLDSSSGDPTIGAYLLSAYAAAYGDIHADHHLRVQARLPMQDLTRRCAADGGPGLTVSLAVGAAPYDNPLDRGALGRHLAENTPVGPTATPLMVLQGDDDRTMVPDAQAGYVERRRAMGANVDYRTYPGRGHHDLLADRSPAVDDLIAWTRDRLG